MGEYEYWLASLPVIGSKKKIELIEYFGSAEQIFHLSRNEICDFTCKGKRILSDKKMNVLLDEKNRFHIGEFEKKLKEEEIQMTVYGMKDYPSKLKNIENPPFQLYYKGELPEENKTLLAIVGARECTAYGENIARRIGNACGKNGIDVISGMAKGIDGIAQLAGIQAKGKSYGILGSGVDICYPEENRNLYELLKTNGGILSEYPPKTLPRPNLFPPRNRIISALSDAIIVVESREKSGTKITVEMALEQGKDVYVVPGRVTDGLSEGCNQLIKEGARVITSIDSFMEEFMLDRKYAGNADILLNHKMFRCEQEEIIYQLFDYQPKNLNTLLQELGEKQGMMELMEHVLTLEMKSYIKRVGVNSYVLNS